MQRDLGIYGGLLIFGLGLAYWASQPASEVGEERVQVFSLDPNAVVEVAYTSKDPKSQIEIITTATKRSDDERYWISYTKSEPSEPAPVSSADGISADIANKKDD